MKSAFIVEGDQEQEIVQRLCKGHTVRAIRTNGEDMPTPILAKFINDELDDLIDRFFPIFILVDREKRIKTPATKLIAEILDCLKEYGRDLNQVKIGVPDLKIENWIIPFVGSDGIATEDPSDENFEGRSCIGELERRLAKQNIIYDKIEHGPRLFRKIDPPKLAQISESFKLFYDQAEPHCWWLQNKNQFSP